MRVFSALFPPDDVVEDFSRVIAPLQRHYPDLDWTPPLLWHMSLTYFGNLSLQDTQRLTTAIGTFGRDTAPFPVRVGGAGASPSPAEGETLFAKLEGPEGELRRLYLGSVAAVQGFGWVLDRRRFLPHFPLARSLAPFNFTELVELVGEYQSQTWDVTSVALVWSRPGDDGRPYFELLGEHPLLGGPVQPMTAAAPLVPLPSPPVAPPPPRPFRPVASEACTPATVDW